MSLARAESLRYPIVHSKIASIPVVAHSPRGVVMRSRLTRRFCVCVLGLALTIGIAAEANAQRLSPGMLCSWEHRAPGSNINAQSGMVPYYGKNQIHYDKFEWYIYQTDHFEIYYYPE